ncbi:hypothetical protein [Flavobacterium sp.]|uniref:beta strand repeat-containing protein n=1 Tax=Flavobacterium sp. TaxID=239 RepID=UPI002621F48A|nr:hypothetical protein [Flavobacterium sp.]
MKKILLFLGLCCTAIDGYAQVGINTTSPDAQLHIKSSNQATPTNKDGILIPKIDAFPAINPTAAQQGMMVYLTTLSAGKPPGFYYWDNTGTPQWKGFGGSGWELTGNSGTDPNVNFIGTTDANDVVFRRDNVISGKIGMANTSFGRSSMNPANSGIYNSTFGLSSMSSNTNGSSNSAFGNYALFGNTSGSSNTGIGSNTLYTNTIGQHNTALGSNSLEYNTQGNDNSAIGYYSLYKNTLGLNNTANGSEALYENLTGNNNTAIGYRAGKLATGDNNLTLGANADVPIVAGSHQMSIANVIYGTAMNSATLAKIGINEPAPKAKLQINASNQTTPDNTDGIIIPKIDAFPITDPTAAQNGMMVFLTAPANQSGFYYWDNPSTSWKGIGANTGWSLTGNAGTDPAFNFIGTTDDQDVTFRRDSFDAGRIGTYDTSFGRGSLRFNTGSGNTAIGNSAMGGNILGFNSGVDNTAVGMNVLLSNTTGSYNAGLGRESLAYNKAGSSNTAFGRSTMIANTNASKNVALGERALYKQSFANGGAPFDTDNVAVGVESLFNNNPTAVTNGINNTAVGNYSLKANTIGHKNIAVGNGALAENTQGVDNVGVGYLSLQNNTDGISNTSIGNYALEYGNASNNTALGYYALNHIGGNNNAAMGYFAMGAATMGAGNTSQGAYSLLNVTGTYNTSSGFRAGDNITSGNYNISIGANSDVINPAADYQMSIGNVFYGEAMDNINTARFGIGTVPSGKDKLYVYNVQTTLPPNDDGQSSIYGFRTRTTQNDGTAYSRDASNSAVKGHNNWGDKYSFGVSGFSYNDTGAGYNRSGGVLGAVWDGVYWGSLGYRSSAPTNYGVYATAALATGAGRMSQRQNATSIGGGFYGDMIGSWSKGNIIGQMSSGSLFASYNSGDEYTAGKQIELVDTGNQKTAAYTVTSTESIIYKKGKTLLVNGGARVDFDKNYSDLLGEIPVITVSPMGECNGLYIASIDENGFTIKELNNGSSNVSVSWIAVGDRIDAQQTKLPKALLEKEFDNNINEVMFNENNKTENAKAIWFDGTDIKTGQLPSQFIEKSVDKKE